MYGYREKFPESLSTPMATIPEIVPIDPMNEYAYKIWSS